MSFKVRFTAAARADVSRLTTLIAERDTAAARRAREAIGDAVRLLERFPFSCRTAGTGDPFLREMVVPFGQSGFVVLYRIEDKTYVTISAVRHQREDDYY